MTRAPQAGGAPVCGALCWPPIMQTIENQTFTGKRIPLDGTQFVNCTFEKCVLVFRGEDGTAMQGCQIHETGFVFEGSAAKTIELMAAMHQGGFQEMVEATIATIRGEGPQDGGAAQA